MLPPRKKTPKNSLDAAADGADEDVEVGDDVLRALVVERFLFFFFLEEEEEEEKEEEEVELDAGGR